MGLSGLVWATGCFRLARQMDLELGLNIIASSYRAARPVTRKDKTVSEPSEQRGRPTKSKRIGEGLFFVLSHAFAAGSEADNLTIGEVWPTTHGTPFFVKKGLQNRRNRGCFEASTKPPPPNGRLMGT